MTEQEIHDAQHRLEKLDGMIKNELYNTIRRSLDDMLYRENTGQQGTTANPRPEDLDVRIWRDIRDNPQLVKAMKGMLRSKIDEDYDPFMRNKCNNRLAYWAESLRKCGII